MTGDPEFDQEVTELLRTGVRNMWYCIAASHEVGDKPLAITRLGEKLVLWRDASGEVCVQENACPHRGLALSQGSVVEGRLNCAYHGLVIDRDGAVRDVPAFGECPYIGEKLVKTYPSFEHYQGIFAYFGDGSGAEAPPFTIPEDIASPDIGGILHTDTWNGNYHYVYDNLADPMHAPYLHKASFNLGGGSRSDKIKIQDTAHGFEVSRGAQRGQNFDWMEFVDTGAIMFCRVEVFYPPSCGPGGPLKICFFTTPIDAGSTRIFAWRIRESQGWERDLWRFLFKTRLVKFADAILEQDKSAAEAMPRWPTRENLYQHDVGLARLRRHLRLKAEAQLRERQAAAAE